MDVDWAVEQQHGRTLGDLRGLRKHIARLVLFALFAIVTGILAGMVRTNDPALFGLTQPQIWSFALVVLGFALLMRRPQWVTPAGSDIANQPGIGGRRRVARSR